VDDNLQVEREKWKELIPQIEAAIEMAKGGTPSESEMKGFEDCVKGIYEDYKINVDALHSIPNRAAGTAIGVFTGVLTVMRAAASASPVGLGVSAFTIISGGLVGYSGSEAKDMATGYAEAVKFAAKVDAKCATKFPRAFRSYRDQFIRDGQAAANRLGISVELGQRLFPQSQGWSNMGAW
jgi:hypothetical protein